MSFTNINITDNENHSFQYILEYIKGSDRLIDKVNVGYLDGLIIDNNTSDDDVVFFYNPNDRYVKFGNHWYNKGGETLQKDLIPNTGINESYMRLYFPDFSIDTYHSGHQYALTVGTWICGKCIILGSYIISRIDALACSGMKTFFNERYYEYIDLPMIDPLDLIYSDDWQEWRENVCFESESKDLVNSVGSVLYCALHPVKKTEDEYIKLDGYTGGQSSININNENTDFLRLNIATNTTRKLKAGERPAIEFAIVFNNYYQGDLKEYLNETYGGSKITQWDIKYELIIGNDSKIYSIVDSEVLNSKSNHNFTKDQINWGEDWKWVEGVSIKGSADIFKNNQPFLTLLSNSIPLTQELYTYLRNTDFKDKYNYFVNNVNLEEVDNMQVLNINAVNKTVNQTVKLEKPSENLRNLTQTVFYRSVDAQSIVIHPNVNENICINLDSYKHLVSSFVMQIEGVKFVEIGRNKSGIIFKIIGTKLPKQLSAGQYYILNQDLDLVTSGKYMYEV